MNALNRDDLLDIISEAINDSLDVDWRPEYAARAVIDALEENGIFLTTITAKSAHERQKGSQ